MSERLEEKQITRVNVGIIKADDKIAIGAELTKRIRTDGGKIMHEPYLVASLLYREGDVKTLSTRHVLITACSEIVRLVDDDTKLVIFRGKIPHFNRRRRFKNVIEEKTKSLGREVKFKFNPSMALSHRALLLADDAIKRGSSLITLL